jgi:CheY-like chemotaxis protein
VTPRAGGRVLVVDDNRDAAQLLAETLRFGGFEVATAFDGIEALQTLKPSGLMSRFSTSACRP